MQAISRGDVELVGIDRDWYRLKPESLISYVEKNLTKTDDLGFVAIYRRQGPCHGSRRAERAIPSAQK